MKKVLSLILLFSLVFLVSCSTANRSNAAGVSTTGKLSSQNSGAKTPETENTASLPVKPENNKFPDWFIQDLQIASNAHFPIQASNYNLDWNSPGYSDSTKNFNVFDITNQVWVAEYSGTKSLSNYSYYWGPEDVQKLYTLARDNPQGLLTTTLTPIYVLESNN